MEQQLYEYENNPKLWPVFSYSGGPTQLPRYVMNQIQQNFTNYNNTGISILETSSYSHEFHQILNKAYDDLKYLYDIPSNFKIIFCSGGGTLLFDAIPMNLLKGKKKATYLKTGYWSRRAINEAVILCPEVEIAAELEKNEEGLNYVKDMDSWNISNESAYLHYCDNETVEGMEYQFVPKVPNLPLVCDMSSNFLTKKIDWDKLDLVYAHAQKNIGIAGSALMVINEKLVDSNKLAMTPYMCDFEQMLKQQSLINTLPVFPIYVNSLVFNWMRQYGNVERWEDRMNKRAKRIYDAIDNSHGVFRCQVAKKWRSRINVSFTLKDEESTGIFLQKCEENGMIELKGHRSVGGCRASLYVPVPEIGIQKLSDFMQEYCQS